MEQQEQLLLEPLLQECRIRRRDLLPVWMKVFIWMFMLTGAIAPICLLASLTGARLQLALYGLEATDLLSTAGLIISLLFLYKGIVAYSLWSEKDWAIHLGVIDAIVGILICMYVMAVAPFVNSQLNVVFKLRLELIVLIPYLIKLLKLKSQWQRRSIHQTGYSQNGG